MDSEELGVLCWWLTERDGLQTTNADNLTFQNRRDLPRDTPLVRVEVLRVIFFSTHSDDGNPSSANIKQALCESNAICVRESNTSSWKSCQGGSFKLNLPDHRFTKYGDGVPFQLSQIQNCMLILKYKDMMKAQVHVTQVFRYSDTQRLP
ncbi:hypothetical protein Tco_1539136 [Tanacetum coccineum]